MTKTLIGVLAALLLAACSTTPTQEGGAPVDELRRLERLSPDVGLSPDRGERLDCPLAWHEPGQRK